MLIHQAYRYELKLNNKQRSLLLQYAGTARFVYNWGLAQQFKALKKEKPFPNYKTLHKKLVRLKKKKFSWMYDLSKCVPSEALRNLNRAWKNKREGRAETPKFKKKGKCKDSFYLEGAVRAKGKTVQLPNLGQLRVKEDTGKLKGRILSVTVRREADRWFVSFKVKRKRPKPKKKPAGKPVGLDLGIKTFVTFSDGTSIDSPKPLQKNLKKLRRLSGQLSRKKKGSNNRKKAAGKLARFHRKIKNQRLDFLHKLSTKLTKTKSTICVETLVVKEMMESKGLARSISDLGWGEFLTQLQYKAPWYRSKLKAVDQWFPSSKTCCVCGFVRDELPLSVREWTCPQCKTLLPRDENAAVNTLIEGLGPKRFLKHYPEFQGKKRLHKTLRKTLRKKSKKSKSGKQTLTKS